MPSIDALEEAVINNPFRDAVSDQSGWLGWAAAEIRMLLVSGRKAELMGLVVSVRARREGVVKALVEATEGWVCKQGLNAMTVRSNVLRPESHPFYEKLGYKPLKTQHVYVKRF